MNFAYLQGPGSKGGESARDLLISHIPTLTLRLAIYRHSPAGFNPKRFRSRQHCTSPQLSLFLSRRCSGQGPTRLGREPAGYRNTSTHLSVSKTQTGRHSGMPALETTKALFYKTPASLNRGKNDARRGTPT